MADVTLKMRPRSPKYNHFFPLSQCCFCASLVKIHPWFKNQSADKAHFTVFIVW